MTALLQRSALWLLPAALCLPLTLLAQQAPTNVSAAFDAKGQATISWTGNRGQPSYRVLRAPDPKSQGQDITRPLDPGTTSFIDGKASAGEVWFYQVVAVYADGSEGASTPVQLQAPVVAAAGGRAPRSSTIPLAPMPAPMPMAAPPPPPPVAIAATAPRGTQTAISGAPRLAAGPPPTGLTINGTPAQASLNWQSTPGAASYLVTRREVNAPPVQMALSNPGWADKGLRPSTAYTYTVDALYADGRVGSTTMPFTTPPAINPVGLAATPAGPGKVRLSWQTVTYADYYVVIGPGSSSGGVKVSHATPYYVATGVPAGMQTWMVGSYYDPNISPVGSPTVGPNAVSTPATQFPKVSINVAAIPVSTAHTTNFNPPVHGFGFVNDFKNSFIGPPISMTTGGLCGGMSYAVLDYYFASKAVPGQFFRPANNTTLQQYLYARQVTSLLQNLDKWAELSVNPMGSRDTEFFNWGLNERLAELRSFIDRGVPVPVSLKGGGGPNDSRDHQVIAIGYDMGRYAGDLGSYKTDLKIFLLDPNFPRQVMTLVPDPTTQEYYEVGHGGERWQTYFVDGKYQPMIPPNAVNPVYPADNLLHELRLEFTTGADDMRGGADHVDMTIRFANGTSQLYPNISQNGIWLSGYIETAQVILNPAVPESSIKFIEIVTNATGGLNGDNWDLVTVGIKGLGGPGVGVHNIIANLAGPFRFTGARAPLVIKVP